MKGSRNTPSHIIDEEHYPDIEVGNYAVPFGCKILKVPSLYYKDFAVDMNRSLMDIAGESVNDRSMLFDDITSCYHKDLIPHIDLKCEPLPSMDYDVEGDLWRQMPKDLLDEDGMIKRFPNAKRFIHVDLATTGIAGICMVHKEMKSFTKEKAAPVYVVDFIASVTGNPDIEFERLLKFLIKMVKVHRVRLSDLTFDTFQSSFFIQKCKSNFLASNIGTISVDKAGAEAYNVLSSIIDSGYLLMGRADKVQSEICEVYIDNRGKAVVPRGMRKDVTDALCGAVFNAHCSGIPAVHRFDVFSDQLEMEASEVGADMEEIGGVLV